MGLRLFYGLLLLFVAGWFYFFRPYEVDRPAKSSGGITFWRFDYKELDQNGTRLWLAGEWGRLDGERITAQKPLLRDAERNETLGAEYGVYDQERIELTQNVRYRSPVYRFESQKAIYHLEAQKLHVPVPFWLFHKDLNATGSELFYFKKSGKIVAYDIKAKAIFR